MRASPYDLSQYESFPPIKIETHEGRKAYEQAQRLIAAKAAPLRNELIQRLQLILDH
jgi:hypothetical protein